MKIILSISAWYNFIVDRLLLDAVFLPVAILAFLAFFNRAAYRRKSPLRFLLTALIIILVSRYAFFVYVNMEINTRYLYPVAFYVIILSVPGFPVAVRLLRRLTKNFPRLNERCLSVFLLLTLILAGIGKALHPPERKFYIRETAQIIRAAAISGTPLLVSNIDDAERVAWHAGAELLPLAAAVNPDHPVLLAAALKTLSSKKKTVFLLVDSGDAEFRKYLGGKKINFPAGLKFLHEFKIKPGIFYSLYKAAFDVEFAK